MVKYQHTCEHFCHICNRAGGIRGLKLKKKAKDPNPGKTTYFKGFDGGRQHVESPELRNVCVVHTVMCYVKLFPLLDCFDIKSLNHLWFDLNFMMMINECSVPWS